MATLTTKQSAEILGCTDSAVKKMIARGALPATKFGARAWMIDEEDLAGVMSITGGRPREGQALTAEDKERIKNMVSAMMG
jgi:excisionase family DNA binding protein